MEKQNLSKAKYIYKVYTAKDDVVHIEMFPVIYVNQKYVYIKEPGNNMLVCLGMGMVFDDVDSVDIKKFSQNYVSIWLWNPEGIDLDKLDELKDMLQVASIERRIEHTENYIKRFENNLEERKRELEALLALREKYSGRNRIKAE